MPAVVPPRGAPLRLAFLGHSGVGKTLATHKLSAHLESGGWHPVEYAVAAPLKDAARALFGFTYDEVYGPERDLPWIPDGAAEPHTLDGVPITPRLVLQRFGDCARAIDYDVLIQALVRRIRRDTQRDPLIVPIVGDLRLDNEVRILRENGFCVIKIERPSQGPLAGILEGAHRTETMVEDLDYDHLVVNDKTVSDFAARLIDVVRGIGNKP